MLSLLKSIVNRILGQFNYEIRRVKPGKLNGWNLQTDLKTLIKSENPICFDVGANEGQTISLLQNLFSKPTIHAFEPSSTVFRSLELKKHNPEVFLHNFALGDSTSEKEFTNYESSVLSSFFDLEDCQENRFRNVSKISNEMVHVKMVDDFVETNHIKKIDLLKIDTQGYDLNVLKGASQTFQKGMIENVFIEMNFARIYEGQAHHSDIFDFLYLHGLSLIDYYEKNRQGNKLAWCTALFSKS